MNILMKLFFSVMMISTSLHATPILIEVAEPLLKVNRAMLCRLGPQQIIKERMSTQTEAKNLSRKPESILSSSIFKGSIPKKQFSKEDLIKDDTITKLTTYARAVNHEGTILKVKSQESHKESQETQELSILRKPIILNNKIIEVAEPLLKVNAAMPYGLGSEQIIKERMGTQTEAKNLNRKPESIFGPSIFKGSLPTKLFSRKDLMKDDTITRLTTYAKAVNHEGTILTVKNQESHKESQETQELSILKAPGILNNRIMDGFLSLYDRRKIIEQPYVYPHYLNGFLMTEFGDGLYTRGSGLLIGRQYGLTARHCLRLDKTKVEAKAAEFILGSSNSFTLKKTIVTNWKLHDTLDVAVFKVDRPVGDELGWAALRELTNSEVMEKPFEVSVTGYPAYKSFASYYRNQEKDMFTMKGVVNKIMKDAIYYDLDTSGGQSGSGITKFEDGVLKSYGVHTDAAKNPVDGNEGVRIDGDLLAFVEKFIKEN